MLITLPLYEVVTVRFSIYTTSKFNSSSLILTLVIVAVLVFVWEDRVDDSQYWIGRPIAEPWCTDVYLEEVLDMEMWILNGDSVGSNLFDDNCVRIEGWSVGWDVSMVVLVIVWVGELFSELHVWLFTFDFWVWVNFEYWGKVHTFKHILYGFGEIWGKSHDWKYTRFVAMMNYLSTKRLVWLQINLITSEGDLYDLGKIDSWLEMAQLWCVLLNISLNSL